METACSHCEGASETPTKKPWARFVLALGACLSMTVTAARSEVISPRRLVEIADISGPVMSPDGRQVAFRIEQASVERNAYESAWYVQDMDGSRAAIRVGYGGNPLRSTAGISEQAIAVWSPDSRSIYYRALVDGKIDVWRADADGSGAKPLTGDPADVRAFSLNTDGTRLTYSVGATREAVIAGEQAEYDRGIRIDESIPIGQGLSRSSLTEGRPASQRLGLWFNRISLLSDVADKWKVLDLQTGQRRDVESPPSPDRSALALVQARQQGRPEPWRVTADESGNRIAVLTRTGAGESGTQGPRIELAVQAGKPRRIIPCQDARCVGRPITGIAWRPHSDEVLYTTTDGDEGLSQSIFRWNTTTGAVLPVAQARGQLNGGERYGREDPGCATSAAALACVTAQADQPPRLERIDLEDGSRRVLFDPNASLAADLVATTPARLLRWTASNGLSYSGWFYPARRTGNAPAPLFVTYYLCLGFPRGGYGGDWPLATFAEHGISSLCINEAPLRFNAAERYDQGAAAVERVVDVLVSSGEVDRAKVGMGELSFGTEVTMWTAVHSDVLAAASITSPLFSRTMYLHGSLREDEFFSNLYQTWQLRSAQETPEQWRILALEANLDKVQAPVLMQMPEQEYLWALDYAIPLMRAGKADLYAFPNEPHFKFQPKHMLAANERNVDWFRYWLQGYEDPDPAKREQYRIWRTLKGRPIDQGASDPGEAGH
ncbi:Atxe2 family lasso peptide isopeptidase [Pseudoxanthomonas winnipegensis]|jgi:dipeptidyl aminopeptidase/acylaminoacyl peptidase|uniref:Atxe2 family lasso peptide isopeptidase n=2 Tax=Lysobacterales TaxID=135614 RepID=A0A2W5M7I4_9GAMM|nr:MAG: Atxe2 family lasso peptide isopeptidase [Rhodanobacter denitrificans]RZZ90222.1 Atxe2 family lasso peptide isopeptidase [Pseudoxanthomonas winnipegensis]